jgi:type IV pilus assembly protein PilM
MRRLLSTIVEKTRFRAGRPLIGLDIGTSSIKGVQLTRAGQGYRVAAFATEPLPPGVLSEDGLIDRADLAAAIRRLLERTGLRSANVAAALPGKSAIVKRITLPAMTSAELDAAIGWEAEQHIPFPLSDVQLHYETLGTAGDGARSMDVLLVAARRESVAALAAVIADAGHTATVVDIGALALRNAYTANRVGGRGATVALLDVGASATTVTIVVDREPAFVRHVTLGGQAYTEAIQAAFDLSFEAAEEVKTRAMPAGPRGAEIESVLHATTGALVGEIRSTLDFFRSATGAERIDRLFVCGGGSLIAGLLDALRQRLDIVTVPFDPFRLLGGAPKEIPTGGSIAPCIAGVAVGLALRREDGR